jgi:hypothetical protein
VSDYYAQIASGANDLCVVSLPVRAEMLWLGGKGAEAARLAKCLTDVFGGFPEYPIGGGLEVIPTSISDYDFHRYDKGRIVRKMQGEAIERLAWQTRLALLEARAAGVVEGRNLLAQLAAGELTNADFELRSGLTSRG